MIVIKNLFKKFGEYKALNNVSLTFPKKGMVIIQGASGCGKTTFLNCLAGLLPFDGTIKIDNYEYKNKTESQNSLFRLSNIGFVFQDFRLFENETVLENIMFPLDTLNNTTRGRKLIKSKELLHLVGLNGKEKQYASNLSGGEKQRVCIARSIVNDPKIILADEPTGSLDEKNSTQIMDILSKISKKSLVIVVTHDDLLAKKYGDQIIKMKDGNITDIVQLKTEGNDVNIPIAKTRSRNKKPSVPLLFVFKHSLHALFKKKARSIICTITTSIGLIGVGLSLSISSCISTNVKQAYSSLIKKDQIIVSAKNGEQSKYGEYNASIYETKKIAEHNKEYIYDVGVNYVADFEDIFCDTNELDLLDSSYRAPIRGVSARNINEFEWLDNSDELFYPEKYESLEDDEIVLGMPISSILDLCYLLRIERNVSSLSNYLANNDCFVVFNFEHLDWDYSDEQILNIRGFCLSNDIRIYHTNHLWNEYMFEERMRFPISEGKEGEFLYPWTLRKFNYLYCNENIDMFLTSINSNLAYKDYVLEIADRKHFPLLYKNVDIKDRRRVIVFQNKLDCIDCGFIKILEDFEPNICEPIIGTNGSYAIYPSNLMMGFAQKAFLSFEINNINDAIDIENSYQLEQDQHIEYPKELIQGHFTKSMQNGLCFSVIPNYLDSGRAPETIDEIAISKSISERIKGTAIGKEIYFSFPSNSVQTNTGETMMDYKIVPLTVTGIVNSGEDTIYHNYMWPVSFFQSRIGISMFNLKCNSISFSVKNTAEINNSIKHLQIGFPQFDIINPLKDIDDSVKELSNYVSIVALIFSLFASITSILLLTICSYLHVYETRNEIGLARCIGVNKLQASKFVYSHALTLAGISFALSSFELVGVSLIISLEMNGNLILNISVLPFLAMFGLAMIISLFASLCINLSLRKHNPIEATKY